MIQHSYFKQACSWADDKYGLMATSRKRYQVAFIASLIAVICLCLSILCLMPLKQVQTIAVHHYDNGVTTVAPLSEGIPNMNQAQIESDIVRYIINRESYDSSSYRSQFELVGLLSSDTVTREYEAEQSTRNEQSPINVLGTKVTRSVHIYSINFIDTKAQNENERKSKRNHDNLAEVVFSIKDRDKASNRDSEQQYSAIISWRYTKPSNSIEKRWKNFDGFEVTRFTKSQRNV